ncbi:hypothetical protein MPSEU_001015300 [Mayamaea pseudoterrestris]|nr:hypothetical protein MPSEU_001015300 [Mayamaea pseudoterrestris]
MRLSLAVAVLLSSASSASAYSSSSWGVPKSSKLFSTVEGTSVGVDIPILSTEQAVVEVESNAPVTISGAAIKERLESMLQKLQKKDATSRQLSKEDLEVVFEDEHIVVINKPTNVLTVTSNGDHPNLAQSVFDAIGCEASRADMMVVHRLGMDTSGLIVFAKTTEALRNMHTAFRTRTIERKYEALVCGHVEKDEGMIDLPLMRDYVFPPFMRVSTDEHQQNLLQVDPEELDKKYLQAPKESLTKFSVIAREELEGQPVTRVALTSISGRTHQLNVHLAAFGHPIVGDTVYGVNGWAARDGGLTEDELSVMVPNASRASLDLQKAISNVAKTPCVHAKSLKFRHPVTLEELSLSVDAPF